MRRLPILFWMLFIGLALAGMPNTSLKAQVWVRHHEHATARQPAALFQCPNGDYMLGYNDAYFSTVTEFGGLARLNPNGDTLWQRELETDFWIRDAALDAAGGCIVIGLKDSSNTGWMVLKHVDDLGNTDWSRQLGEGDAHAVLQSADGGFVLTGRLRPAVIGGYANYFVTKTDSMGQIRWTDTLDYATSEGGIDAQGYFPSKIVETAQGDLLFAGYNDSLGSNTGTFLVKLDPAGMQQWEVRYWDIPAYVGFAAEDICLANDGGVAMVGMMGNLYNAFIKTDTLGAVQVYHTEPAYQTWSNRPMSAIVALRDGGYFMASGDVCFKTDAGGNVSWLRTPPQSYPLLPKVLEDDEGYLLLHFSFATNVSLPQGAGIARYDSSGFLYPNLISGTVYADLNGNCIQEPSDVPLPNMVVMALPGPFYTTADHLGHYVLDVDTGTYTVTTALPFTNWHVFCPSGGSYTQAFPVPFDTATGLDFALDVDAHCAAMGVEIMTPFLRLCATNALYQVHYWNHGIDTAHNVRVQVVIDSFLTVTSSTLPWMLPQVGDTFDFLLGSVPPLASASFTLTATVTCDTNLMGRTLCTSATIFADSSCLPVSPQWDLASIEVEGTCINNDSVRFTIANVGAGNMAAPGGLVILEDDIMVIMGTFDLQSMEDTVITLPANGRTLALLAEQSPAHPGQSYPRAFVEACGTNGQGGFSSGHINTQMQDELDASVAIDCHEVVTSFDPNDKQVVPGGIGTRHYVSANDRMEYIVRFQNTGNDTAFKVVIRDQLDPSLDVLSLLPGPSSHPYTWLVRNSGELEFTFLNILLPDSNVNEAASHGFVSYTIRQLPGNPDGTMITNEADIYFDYNSAVTTNETFGEVASQPWSYLVYTLDAVPVASPSVKVWPNPFSHNATIDLGEASYKEIRFELWDFEGRLVQQQVLHGAHVVEVEGTALHAGAYIFRVLADGKLKTGKIVVVKE